MEKKFFYLLVCAAFCGACASVSQADLSAPKVRVQTRREKAYYLSSEAAGVRDTCPGHDILRQYTCPKDARDGFSCFDAYMVQGSPVNEQRYTLLSQTVEKQPVSAQPQCPVMEADCASFLRALNYNLEFSWYLVNFPTSSFARCRETYDCKRIDCYLPADASSSDKDSTLVSCVYKRNQIFFVGAEVSCLRGRN